MTFRTKEQILKLTTLLDQMGIGYKVLDDATYTTIILRAKEDKNVFGYTGFETEFTFNKKSGYCEVIISE